MGSLDLDRKNWLVIPREISGLEYEFIVDPARLKKSILVTELIEKFSPGNWSGISKDSLNREFVDYQNWEELIALNLRMEQMTMNPEEFSGFVKTLVLGSIQARTVYNVAGKEVNYDLLRNYREDLFDPSSSVRGEVLDARFRFEDGKLIEDYNHQFDEKKKLVPERSIVLNCEQLLLEDRGDSFRGNAGINLAGCLFGKNVRGLPSKDVEPGNNIYTAPQNNSVAKIFVWKKCLCYELGAYSFDRVSGIGIRGMKRIGQN